MREQMYGAYLCAPSTGDLVFGSEPKVLVHSLRLVLADFVAEVGLP
jgi:hypothetical protein